MFDHIGATVEYNKQIVNCDLEDGRWVIKSADGTTFTSDGLIVTMPVPQILNLNGTIKSVIGLCLLIILGIFIFYKIMN